MWDNLDFDSDYSLKVLKKANENLLEDEIHSFKTVKAFKITDFKYIDNSLACVYFTNDLFLFSSFISIFL